MTTQKNITKIEKPSKLKTLMKQIFRHSEDLREELTDFFEDIDITVSNDQIQMMLGIIKLVNIDANKVKIPNSKMVTLPLNASLKESVAVLKKSGHTRIPIIEEKDGKKEYCGVLFAKDLLPSLITKTGRFKLQSYIRKVVTVPESQGLLSLLRQMRLSQTHLVLTVNEYGDVTGLITMEDILEEIVGDIRDEYDRKERNIKEIGHRTYKVDATLPLHEINNELTINLPEERFNTLGGFLLHELKGEVETQQVVHYGNISITLETVKDKLISSALITIEATKN